MERSPKPDGAAGMQEVREGIKRRYAAYHTLNRDGYPVFAFNSNRANYQPLRDSFEEEFFVVRKIDRVNNHLHIPSLNTLALLFTDETYVPSRKILNTCRSYAEGILETADTSHSIGSTTAPVHPRRARLLLVSMATVLFVVLSALAGYRLLGSADASVASGLVIHSPRPRQIVPRLPYVEGNVTNAKLVWIVVHPALKDQKFYVQDVIKVNKDGSWKGRIFVGKPDSSSNGVPFEIRAYVKPGGSYRAIMEKAQYEYNTWPEEAELATESVLVVRGNRQK